MAGALCVFFLVAKCIDTIFPRLTASRNRC
jgi:hypothetical protein